MGALSVRDGGDHRSKKIAPIGMPKAGHWFVADSPLEEARFEPSVPPGLAQLSRLMHAKRCDEIVRANSGAAAVQLDLFFAANHSIDPGWVRFGWVAVGCAAWRLLIPGEQVPRCPSRPFAG